MYGFEVIADYYLNFGHFAFLSLHLGGLWATYAIHLRLSQSPNSQDLGQKLPHCSILKPACVKGEWSRKSRTNLRVQPRISVEACQNRAREKQRPSDYIGRLIRILYDLVWEEVH